MDFNALQQAEKRWTGISTPRKGQQISAGMQFAE